MPPWCEQAPWPASDIVPSLQRTMAGVATDGDWGRTRRSSSTVAGVFLVGRASLFATPPWPEQAPRPALLIVPSLHLTWGTGASSTAGLCATTSPGAAMNTAAITKRAHLMLRPPYP